MLTTLLILSCSAMLAAFFACIILYILNLPGDFNLIFDLALVSALFVIILCVLGMGGAI